MSTAFGRIYAGGDGMATNGLRYGAAIEIRQNFTGQISSNTSSGASGYSSLETLYVRRAFTYVAGENWGIVRVGQADGLIGIFDNGVTTFQFLPTGNLNGGDLQDCARNVTPTFLFLAQAGNEYVNAKLVYLSPQIAGFDFGFQYAPNTSNGFGIGANNLDECFAHRRRHRHRPRLHDSELGMSVLVLGSGHPGWCASAQPDGVGVRYQGAFGGLGVLAYGVYSSGPD